MKKGRGEPVKSENAERRVAEGEKKRDKATSLGDV